MERRRGIAKRLEQAAASIGNMNTDITRLVEDALRNDFNESFYASTRDALRNAQKSIQTLARNLDSDLSDGPQLLPRNEKSRVDQLHLVLTTLQKGYPRERELARLVIDGGDAMGREQRYRMLLRYRAGKQKRVPRSR